MHGGRRVDRGAVVAGEQRLRRADWNPGPHRGLSGAALFGAEPGELRRRGEWIERQVVLDEADRMIDEGFEEPVNQILGAMGSELKAEEEEEQTKQAETESSLTNAYRTTIM